MAHTTTMSTTRPTPAAAMIMLAPTGEESAAPQPPDGSNLTRSSSLLRDCSRLCKTRSAPHLTALAAFCPILRGDKRRASRGSEGRPLIVGHLRRAPDRSTTVRTAVTNVRWSMGVCDRGLPAAQSASPERSSLSAVLSRKQVSRPAPRLQPGSSGAATDYCRGRRQRGAWSPARAAQNGVQPAVMDSRRGRDLASGRCGSRIDPGARQQRGARGSDRRWVNRLRLLG
jgi:hypothetical protein